MERIELNSWQAVSDYIDGGVWHPKPSYFEHVVQHHNYYPAHAFSKGQLASKSWLLKNLYTVILQQVKIRFPMANKPIVSNVTVSILGSWIGTLVEPLLTTYNIDRIYGIDCDAEAIEKSERLNQRWVQQDWRYKGVVADVNNLDCSDMQFETGGELISVKPKWIINTSCEHMTVDWFNTVDSDQLIIMQTNNSEEFEGHINVCDDVAHMQAKYPLSETLYVGELITPAYTRLMQMGYK